MLNKSHEQMTCQPIWIDDPSDYKELEMLCHKIKPELHLIKIGYYYDHSEPEGRTYDVYQLITKEGTYVLKRTKRKEAAIYENFLGACDFAVPRLLGYMEEQDTTWILLQHIEGRDLKQFNESIALACARELAKIFNTYWQEQNFEVTKLDDRFEKYWERINRRRQCLKELPQLKEAYDLFLARQRTCPRTLCNGDLLQCNALYNEDNVTFIDWAFGGIMPYALDVARLIAHGAEVDDPFYMTDNLRMLFLENVYKQLVRTHLSYEQFIRDIKLACLNECIEFIEQELLNPDKERDHYFDYYLKRANLLAKDLLINQYNTR